MMVIRNYSGKQMCCVCVYRNVMIWIIHSYILDVLVHTRVKWHTLQGGAHTVRFKVTRVYLGLVYLK